MMFLLRTAFWLSVVLALLPSFVAKPASPVQTEGGTADAMTAASETVADLRGFCERRPEACAAGIQLANAFGQRAQAGAKIVYEFFGDKLGKGEPARNEFAKSEIGRSEIAKSEIGRGEIGKAEHIAGTGAGGRASSAATAPADAAGVEAAKASQHTLSSSDLAMPWRGPQHRRDSPPKRTSQAAVSTDAL